MNQGAVGGERAAYDKSIPQESQKEKEEPEVGTWPLVEVLRGSDSLAQSQIRGSPCRSTKDSIFEYIVEVAALPEELADPEIQLSN